MNWKDILKAEEKAHCGSEKADDEKEEFEKKLIGNQKRIDANKDGKITGEDFKLLNKGKDSTLTEKTRKELEKATQMVLREIEKEGGALGMKNLDKIFRDKPELAKKVLTKLKKEGKIFVHQDGDIYTHKPSRGRGFTA
jgi:hypothetical protein|tara:strand:- start:430 stop:846 length:417 start_codon:yes stop_codon:yes gene_type:complete